MFSIYYIQTPKHQIYLRYKLCDLDRFGYINTMKLLNSSISMEGNIGNALDVTMRMYALKVVGKPSLNNTGKYVVYLSS